MIDKLRGFSRKAAWLVPGLFAVAGLAAVVFGYVVLAYEGHDSDGYLIPCIIVLLWSLGGAILLLIFPYVPPKPEIGIRFAQRFKIRLLRAWYHLASWGFCLFTVILFWLTFKLANVWRVNL